MAASLPLAALVPAVVLAGLALAGAAAAGPARPSATAPLSAVAALGERLFYDPALSGSGQMSCASCHDPANHYAPANDLAVQLGGPHLDLPGIRATPTLTYKVMTSPFSVGPGDAEDQNEATPMAEARATVKADAAVAVAGPLGAEPAQQAKGASAAPDIVPQGGLFWDGRADTLEEQAQGPLLSPFEMANPDKESLYRTLRRRYGGDLAALFGRQVLADRDMLLAEASFAIARYQVESPSFHPFTSKYDYYLRGQARLSPAEQRGLALFDDSRKGGCAACHLDKTAPDGRPPTFTDYEFEALGVPRNPAIPANADPAFFDLGICGPLRHDLYARQPENCGLFKTPTLRNAATRKAFFHNGVFRSLDQVLHFYVERETDPERFYPRRADGSLDKYDDLPPRYRANVDTIDPPFDRRPGGRPALDDAEIADVVAFLKTLTDGYDPEAASPVTIPPSPPPAGGG